MIWVSGPTLGCLFVNNRILQMVPSEQLLFHWTSSGTEELRRGFTFRSAKLTVKPGDAVDNTKKAALRTTFDQAMREPCLQATIRWLLYY